MSDKKKKSWVVGVGHDGLEDDVPTSTKRIVTEEEKAAAASAVGKVTSSVTSADHASRFVDAAIKLAGKKVTTRTAVSMEIKDVADEAGVTVTFARFFVKDGLAEALEAQGFKLDDATTGTISLIKAGKGATKKAAPKVKAAKADEPAAEGKPKVKVPKAKTIEIDEDFFMFDDLKKAKAEAALGANLNIWGFGPTGCGKSEFYERLLNLMSRGYEKVSMNGESSTDEILGSKELVIKDGVAVTEKSDGALQRCMRDGKVLIVEEISSAAAEVNLALQRSLEKRGDGTRRYCDPDTGEEIVAAPGFLIIATDNTSGGGDHTGLYAGTQLQNAAFRNRFTFERFGYLPAADEVRVLQVRTGLDKDVAKGAVKFAGFARHAVENGEIFSPVATRNLLAFGELYAAYLKGGLDKETSLREALNSAILYQASSPSDEEALRGMAQRVFGAAAEA